MAYGFRDNYEKAEVPETSEDIHIDGSVIAEGFIVDGHDSPIGTLITVGAPETVVPNDTSTALCSITVPAGAWHLEAQIRFPRNGDGARRANLSTLSGYNAIHVQQDGAQGGMTQMQTSLLAVNSSETTYYLNAVQYSGVDLTLPAGTSDGYINGIRAVRIA